LNSTNINKAHKIKTSHGFSKPSPTKEENYKFKRTVSKINALRKFELLIQKDIVERRVK